jgi:hypothetical protein
MPEIPAAFRRPATVTTHQVEDHDAPGGSDLEAQLLEHAGQVAPSGIHPAPHALVDTTGITFPARIASAMPAHAEVARREPWTAPEISLEILPDSSLHNVETAEHVRTVNDPDQLQIALPHRRQVVVGRVRVANQALLDGTGAGVVELTPNQWGTNTGAGAGVQQNQRWLLDRVVARGGAAGDCLIYAGASGNDQDLVGVIHLAASSFAQQIDGNPVQLLPGWRVTGVGVGAGNNATLTVVAFYRVLTFAPGLEGVE